MKTAKEWAQEMPCVFPEERQFIRSIQADAIRYAASVINEARFGGNWDIREIRDELEFQAAALEKEKK